MWFSSQTGHGQSSGQTADQRVMSRAGLFISNHGDWRGSRGQDRRGLGEEDKPRLDSTFHRQPCGDFTGLPDARAAGGAVKLGLWHHDLSFFISWPINHAFSKVPAYSSWIPGWCFHLQAPERGQLSPFPFRHNLVLTWDSCGSCHRGWRLSDPRVLSFLLESP